MMVVVTPSNISEYADNLRLTLIDPNDKMAIYELAQALIAISIDYDKQKRSV